MVHVISASKTIFSGYHEGPADFLVIRPIANLIFVCYLSSSSEMQCAMPFGARLQIFRTIMIRRPGALSIKTSAKPEFTYSI